MLLPLAGAKMNRFYTEGVEDYLSGKSYDDWQTRDWKRGWLEAQARYTSMVAKLAKKNATVTKLRGVHKSMRATRAKLTESRQNADAPRIDSRYETVAAEVPIRQVKRNKNTPAAHTVARAIERLGLNMDSSRVEINSLADAWVGIMGHGAEDDTESRPISSAHRMAALAQHHRTGLAQHRRTGTPDEPENPEDTIF